MRKLTGFILYFALVAGCASQPRQLPPHASLPATGPSDPRSSQPLSSIEPQPHLPPAAAAPAGQVTLEAVELYARARDARWRNQPYSAINLLQQVVKLDPQGFEPQLFLAGTYHSIGDVEQAIAAYRRAEAIDSDDLVLHAELGRALMQRHEVPGGIQHLRIAQLTYDYKADPALAAAVDHRLAAALQQAGYDQAALEVYESLLSKLQQPTSSMRAHPEVANLLQRPQLLLDQMARLYEKRGQLDRALATYRSIAEKSPDDFAAQARMVRTLSQLNQLDDATLEASQLVERFRASVDSLNLLRDTYRRAGRAEAYVEVLQQIHADRPNDRVVLFALADALSQAGRGAQAQSLLTGAAEASAGDVQIVSHLAKLLIDQDRLQDCARMLTQSAAQYPQTAAELEPLWIEMASMGRRDVLHVRDIQDMRLDPAAEASRLYALARVAQAWSRPNLADRALDQSLAARPLFPPSVRSAVQKAWSDGGFDEPARQLRTQELITMARDAGNESLAKEIEGLALLARGKPAEAVSAFEAAAKAGPDDPNPLFSEALAMRASGQPERFEQTAWKLISDHPEFAATYPVLFRHYMEKGAGNPARNALETWLSNMPQSIEARLLQATVLLRFNQQPAEAEQRLLRLFEEHPDRLDVIVSLRAFYTESKQLLKLIALLEQRRAEQPYNYPLVAVLVDIYSDQQQLAEAGKAVDAAREELANDPDRLYFISHLYIRLDQPQQSEQTLLRVLELDPSNASAANDLGYTWAEAGKQLELAESLVRGAVENEPKNPMFLDSLGWVLYKRERFDEARQFLERAAAQSRPAPDAVILDHLGDVLYRLDRSEDATAYWKKAVERIAGDQSPTDQDKALRLQLDKKLKQVEQKQPVSVAPTLVKNE